MSEIITEVTELENVDMMAEKTDNNVPEQTRQSMDYTINFNAENTSVQREDSISDDSEVFCTRHEYDIIQPEAYTRVKHLHPECSRPESENINENQTQEKFSAGWNEGKSVLEKKISNSSIRSFDSGYGSIKHKVFSISENDEENKQTDVNFK